MPFTPEVREVRSVDTQGLESRRAQLSPHEADGLARSNGFWENFGSMPVLETWADLTGLKAQGF